MDFGLFVSSFCLVFLLGLQQQNVTHEHHGWSVIISFFIAAAQVAFIKQTVITEFLAAVLSLGCGGAIGASLSIVFHKKIVRRKGSRRRNVGLIGKEIG